MRADLAHHPRTIRLEGVFDVPAAERLARALAMPGQVHVDLEHVREFHDLAVVHLARALDGRPDVTVAGLRQHHLRLLRYLGIDAGPLDGAPAHAAGPAERA